MNKLLLLCALLTQQSFAEKKQPAASPKNSPQTRECTPAGKAPPLAGPGYSDPKFCCKGNIIIINKKNCENKNFAGFAGLCSPCGNNFCDSEWENSCNCPEDCPEP